MPQGGTSEDENVEPGGFEAISRWLSPSTTDDTTGRYVPKPVHPGRGASPWGLENWPRANLLAPSGSIGGKDWELNPT
jgi:hypothetical protein